MKTIHAADLFCGAGGTSTGLKLACDALGYKLDLLAINHWDTAIETHSANHPDAVHMCMNVDQVDPCKAVPSRRLDLLIASPECTHHSIARGGKPINDQSRASAWLVLRWCEALDIKNVLIENVPEFMSWGPLGVNGRPLQRKKGKTFLAFINALESLGYVVKYQVLNAADYGDPTTRKRLFILARKGRRAVVFPEPTHSQDGRADMFRKTNRWRAAREIIDWGQKGESIFNRKKPLSPNTMRRIYAGLQKFSGAAFVIPFFGEYEGKSPRTHDVNAPLTAVTSHGAGGPVQPFVLNIRGGDDGYLRGESVEKPLQTITAQPAMALIEPFVLGQQSQARPRSTQHPLPTIAADGAIALVEPFLMPVNHGKNDLRSHSVEKPHPTQMGADVMGLVEPYLVAFHGGNGHEHRTHSIEHPLPTQDTSNRYGIAEPYLVEFYGNGGAKSVDKPLPTQPTKDKFGLATPLAFVGADGQTYLLDIRFRMLTPKELARAMSFPDDYKFAGNREKVVKQIGNAVAVNTATALCTALLI